MLVSAFSFSVKYMFSLLTINSFLQQKTLLVKHLVAVLQKSHCDNVLWKHQKSSLQYFGDVDIEVFGETFVIFDFVTQSY